MHVRRDSVLHFLTGWEGPPRDGGRAAAVAAMEALAAGADDDSGVVGRPGRSPGVRSRRGLGFRSQEAEGDAA